MPPKRKIKAHKAATTALPKASTSELAPPKRPNSVQGGKTSRLPSIALHMTTRQAAKTASNHTSSGAPSLASTDSRRSSLNSIAQFEDAVVDERPAKRARLSTDSGSPQPSATSTVDQNTVNGTQTPELQRQPPQSISNGKLSRKRRASDESTQSSKTAGARPNGLTRTESDVSEAQPRRKKRKTAKQDPADAADIPPELTDASTAPNSPEQLADVDGSQNLHHVLPTNGDAPAKLGRRLPGRRRAPHPNVNVEKDLRRQLNLKMSYRSLAKVQKNILEELSKRATDSLENDPEYYKQVPAYEPLMAGLAQHKADRLAELNANRRERLDQLERVRIANEHIEREKFIQRFQDLQDDLLLQCYYRMKQIDREAKGQEAEGTDDEENIVPATRFEFPTINNDDRLGSKYASRSRAYVDTEHVLDEDIHRKRLGNMMASFAAKDADADDSIEELPAGFGTFVGPDRTEAVAHWNITSLIDAADDVETAPISLPPPTIIPNEQADALFLLASLSAERPRGSLPPPEVKPELQEEVMPPAAELTRASSPVDSLPPAVTGVMPSKSDSITPTQAPEVQKALRSNTPTPKTNGAQLSKEQEIPKNETPARSTHRIMDMLNNDVEVPVTRVRESQPLLYDTTQVALSGQQASYSQEPISAQNGTYGRESTTLLQETGLTSTAALSSSQPPSEPAPWSPPNRFAPSWTPRMPSYMKGMSEESLRKRDPLNAIRAMLDAKAISEGRIPASQRSDHSDNTRNGAAERDRAREVASSLARPYSAASVRENSDSSLPDTTKAPAASYNASPSAPPLSYHQSPSAAPAYLPARSESQDTTSSHWGRERRLSGSQAPRDRRLSGSQLNRPPSESPYAGSPPQPYHTEPNTSNSNQAARQSPYGSGQQLPSISSSLPPKPPGPPPSGPINFRFAHYDPAPSRQSYPSPAPPGYPPPASHQTSSYSAGPPPPHHSQGYGNPPSYHSGYVPPPGSFQAPPPPPTSLSAYPPLKIHQYGGQPILPANMAPPPPQSQSQQPPMNFVGQHAPQSAYSPPQTQGSMHRRTPSYEQAPPPQDSSSSEQRGSDGPSRPRRQYRSYHAPGTQFRSYQGPDAARRRGG